MHQMLRSSEDFPRVDRRVWRACAGSSVLIPTPGARVYYFPEGHFEQSFSPGFTYRPFADLPLSPPMLLCQISDVHFLADPVTDEVYVKLLLYPITSPTSPTILPFTPESHFEDRSGEILSFAKILTPSDANNGGGFSVPRFCADSIFPPLDYQSDPPVQKLTVTDVHGVSWDFRHIYRGTPRRHLLTTGWSKFVNHKKLVAGDSVVFMRSLRGELFIGVRRAVRLNPRTRVTEHSKWREPIGENAFRRNSRDCLSPEAAKLAVERATQGLPFEAVYYPKVGWYSDFIVRAELVISSLSIGWRSGMRVKMAMETEDSSRMTWFQGTVITTSSTETPWRMLHVRWDEPDVLQNYKNVGPWQVEVITPAASLEAMVPQAKRYKFLEHSGTVFPSESLSSSYASYSTLPGSIQGTRHEFLPTLNIGTSGVSNLSPDSHSTGHYFGGEVVERTPINSIQLFGKVIRLNTVGDDKEDAIEGIDLCTGFLLMLLAAVF